MHEELINAWQSDDDHQINSNNMLRVLQSKIINHTVRITQPSKQKIKSVRPQTGRVGQSALANYSSSQNHKQNTIRLSKKKQNIENRDPSIPQKLQKNSQSMYLKGRNRSRTKTEDKLNKQMNTLNSKADKTICVLEFSKNIPLNQVCTSKDNIIKHKTGDQFPLKKQSLIFNSKNSIKSKNTQRSDTNFITTFHEMQIKLRRQKQKPENIIKTDLLLLPTNYKSEKDAKYLSRQLSKQNTFKAYTRYTRLKRNNQNKKKPTFLIEQQIFGDHHLTDELCFRN